jgi:hypothetical protein
VNGNRVSLPLYYVNQAGCGFTASKYTRNVNNRLYLTYIKIVTPVPSLDLIGMLSSLTTNWSHSLKIAYSHLFHFAVQLKKFYNPFKILG